MAENEEISEDLGEQPRRPRREDSIEVTVETPTSHVQQISELQNNRKMDTNTLPDTTCENKVFKKSLPNNKLTLYLVNRDLVVSNGQIDKLYGVLLVDPEFLQGKKVYGQVTLTFRYGREDEEVMGLKFCNEAIMSLAQIYPYYPGADHQDATTMVQEQLLRKLGKNAHAFSMTLTALAPPSVQLVPAKEYNGAPIGTSYEIRIYVAEKPDEKTTRKTTSLKMGLRVIQGPHSPYLPRSTLYNVPFKDQKQETKKRGTRNDNSKSTSIQQEIIGTNESDTSHAVVEKRFHLSGGRIRLEASLDRLSYCHGDLITVTVNVTNNSTKTIKRVKVLVNQHVDVCMFSNGKFKNTVAEVSSTEGCPVDPGYSLSTTYTLKPEKGATKNWIALEDSFAQPGAILASTVLCAGNEPEDRNVFAIYVSYYVRVKLVISTIADKLRGSVYVDLPFRLMHSTADVEEMSRSPVTRVTPRNSIEEVQNKVMKTFVQMPKRDLIEEYEKSKCT